MLGFFLPSHFPMHLELLWHSTGAFEAHSYIVYRRKNTGLKEIFPQRKLHPILCQKQISPLCFPCKPILDEHHNFPLSGEAAAWFLDIKPKLFVDVCSSTTVLYIITSSTFTHSNGVGRKLKWRMPVKANILRFDPGCNSPTNCLQGWWESCMCYIGQCMELAYFREHFIPQRERELLRHNQT